MDDCLSHGSFRDKHGLSVRLLADVDGDACHIWGAAGKNTARSERASSARRSLSWRGTLKHALYGVARAATTTKYWDY
jgi:peroxiredoxin